MLYLLGKNLSEQKTVHIALLQIQGIGLKKSELICKKLGITKQTKISELIFKQKK